MDTTCVLSANHLLLLDRAIPIYSTASWALALRDLLHLCFFLCLFSCLSPHSSFCLHHFPVSLSLSLLAFHPFPPQYFILHLPISSSLQSLLSHIPPSLLAVSPVFFLLLLSSTSSPGLYSPFFNFPPPHPL